jgi:hypothetical protein
LTEFEATSSQTENRLAETTGPDDTPIVFMADDVEGRTFDGRFDVDPEAVLGDVCKDRVTPHMPIASDVPIPSQPSSGNRVRPELSAARSVSGPMYGLKAGIMCRTR